MRVLVTGSLGHLGQRVSGLLEQQGHRVVGFDLRTEPENDIVTQAERLIEMAAGCEAFIHLAGIPHPGAGGMPAYFRTNAIGTQNTLEAALAVGAKIYVYVSSTGFYGCDIDGKLSPAYFPIDEKHPPAMLPGYSRGKLDAYNQSKVITEALVAWYGTNGLMQTVVLRIAPANTKKAQFTPGQNWYDYFGGDEEHKQDWRRGSLFANCDPDKAAEAIVLAALSEHENSFEVYNVADLYGPADVDLREFILEEFGSKPRRGWNDGDSLISTKKIRVALGWEPCEDR